MIKVTFIITNLGTGGAETMLFKLLQRMDRSRFEPIVISLVGLGEIGPRIGVLGIPVYVLGMSRGIPNPLMIFKLARLLRRVKPDLVHTWMYHADLLGGIAARLAGCSVVLWGLRHSNLSKTENKKTTLLTVKICAKLSLWVPTRILSCSIRAKEVHAAAGYCKEKIHVIPNGFELDRFLPDPVARYSVRSELGLSVDVPLVGFIARYDPLKNHAGFIMAAALLHAKLPNAHFVLAGTEVDEDNLVLQSAISAFDLQKNVHLLGRRDDIPRLMAALDVLASSSHGEAFPNVLGEAMACGVPCVVTDVGDSAEIVGSAGQVVPPGDMEGLAYQLEWILKMGPSYRATVGAQARARVAEYYDIAQVTELYQAFYERILAEKQESR